MKKEREKLEGLIFKSKNYGEFKVLSYDGKNRYNIEFITTGTIKKAATTHLKNGSVMDEFYPSICGIGYLGGKYNTTHFLFDRWHLLLSRCYNPKSKSYIDYGAKGCYVNLLWHNFSNYVDDVITLQGYNEELVKSRKLQLDKDLKYFGNLEYSKENCIWVTIEDNMKEMNKRVKQKYFIATRIIDNYKEEEYNILEFCRKWNFKNSTSITDCLYGRRNDYEGWRFEYKNNPNSYIQNTMSTNKSGFKGVCKSQNGLKYRATATLNRKQISLGVHDNIKDAIIARYEWEVNTFGKFRKPDSKDEYLKNIGYFSQNYMKDTTDDDVLSALQITI